LWPTTIISHFIMSVWACFEAATSRTAYSVVSPVTSFVWLRTSSLPFRRGTPQHDMSRINVHPPYNNPVAMHRRISSASATVATSPSHPTSPSFSTSANELLISDSVAGRLNQIATSKSGSGSGHSMPLVLRISVDAGGCSGFAYSFKLDSPDGMTPADDVVYRLSGGHRVVIDRLSLSLVSGAKLVWNVDGLVRSSFAVIDNPNADSKCGCGASFNPKHVTV